MTMLKTLRWVMCVCTIAAGLNGLFPVTVAADQHATPKVKIGVLAFRGEEATRKRWSATAEYLEWTIGGHIFEVVPLSLPEMKEAVSNGQLDFVLTNTGNYVELEALFGVTRIATMRSPSTVRAGNVFGAVIFTRADRSDIKDIRDLKGKSFMAVERNGFGGFQMAWRELEKSGLDPFDDFSSIEFSGFPQDQSAFAVLDGKVDAATFRTGTLEAMQTEGVIRMDQFKVLNRQQHPGFPFTVSTRLYPEWPFARTKKTTQQLAQKVAIALLSMPENSVAAQQGHYSGWTVPLDYQPVHELFRELRIGPYHDIGQITLMDILKQYGHWIALGAILIIATIVWATWIEVLVKRRTAELSNANLKLERQIAERIRAEEDAQRRRAELAHIDRLNTMGEMASGFAHELNQPLAAIVNFAQGCTRRIKKEQCDSEMILDTLDHVTQQATRAGEIIRRIRGFVRKEAPIHTSTDINHLIKEALAFLGEDIRRQNVIVEQQLQEDLPAISIDHIQIEQVILNLFCNALEAMKETPTQTNVLKVQTCLSNGNRISVSVSDNGPGFTPGDQSMFDPFISSKSNGLGLGLSISRTIVEAHGGLLMIDESPKPGATLSFSLPIDGPSSGGYDGHQ